MQNKAKALKWFESVQFPVNAIIEKIFDVYYIHLPLKNGDDLLITKYGMPFIENLKPENFLIDREWFDKNSERLSGTSCTYKVRTKEVNNKSIDIVIKWNRMGQDIPGSVDIKELWSADFNSPFEEFSLVMELRNTKYESPGKIITQKPLAIYVSSEKTELWQTGRKEYKMQSKIKNHTEVKLDMLRPYLVIYEWIKGIDAAHACNKGIISEDLMKNLTLIAEKEMKFKGFIVRDRKPHHIIIKPMKNGSLFTTREGKVPYALVDFELLERTQKRDKVVKKAKRQNYLKRQRDRFKAKQNNNFPPHLQLVNILGVEYIYGHAESTNGLLWVVGKDPYLFDYFLPERWEGTPRIRLSNHSEIFHTVTKDNINLVWKVSKVGTLPDLDPYKKDERELLEYGYNSPFEEISIAIHIS